MASTSSASSSSSSTSTSSSASSSSSTALNLMIHHYRLLDDRTCRLLDVVVGPFNVANPAAEIERCQTETAMKDANLKDVQIFLSTDDDEKAKSNLTWRANVQRRDVYARFLSSMEAETAACVAITARNKFALLYANDQVRPPLYYSASCCVDYRTVLHMVGADYQIDIDDLSDVHIGDRDIISGTEAMSRRLAKATGLKAELMKLPAGLRMEPAGELIFNKYIDDMTTKMRAVQDALIERMKIRCVITLHQSIKNIEAKAERRANVAMKAMMELAERRKTRIDQEEQKIRDVEEAMAAAHLQNAAPNVVVVDLSISTPPM